MSLDCERSTVYIFDEKRNELWSKVAKGQKRTIKVANGVGIAGTVSQTKEKLNIANAYSDNRFNKEIDHITGYKTNNILCVPILDKSKKCYGVIQCINKKTGTFSGDDEEILCMLADFS